MTRANLTSCPDSCNNRGVCYLINNDYICRCRHGFSLPSCASLVNPMTYESRGPYTSETWHLMVGVTFILLIILLIVLWKFLRETRHGKKSARDESSYTWV